MQKVKKFRGLGGLFDVEMFNLVHSLDRVKVIPKQTCGSRLSQSHPDRRSYIQSYRTGTVTIRSQRGVILIYAMFWVFPASLGHVGADHTLRPNHSYNRTCVGYTWSGGQIPFCHFIPESQVASLVQMTLSGFSPIVEHCLALFCPLPAPTAASGDSFVQ